MEHLRLAQSSLSNQALSIDIDSWWLRSTCLNSAKVLLRHLECWWLPQQYCGSFIKSPRFGPSVSATQRNGFSARVPVSRSADFKLRPA